MDYIYRSSRPRLTVESKGGKKLGNCYSVSYYEVTSTFPLSEDNLSALFESGALGYGQTFNIKNYDDKPTGSDIVPCIGIDGDQITQNPINPYSGKPYGPVQLPFYVYHTEAYCDSGD